MIFLINTLAIIIILTGIGATCLNLPGSILVFGGILLSSWYGDFSVVSGYWVAFFVILTLLSLFIDNLAMLLGSKKCGASKYGMIGAFLGGIILLIFLGPIGILLGPFVGALVFEYFFAKKELHAAAKAGYGALIGTILGIIGKLTITAMMALVWLVLQFSSYFK